MPFKMYLLLDNKLKHFLNVMFFTYLFSDMALILLQSFEYICPSQGPSFCKHEDSQLQKQDLNIK